MYKIFLLAAITGLYGFGSLADSHATAEVEDPAAIELTATTEGVDLEMAASIFARNCRACHGNKAQGVASYPSLSDKTPDYIAEKLEIYRAGERIGPNSVLMIQNAKELTDDEINSLAVYVTSAFDE